MSTDNEAETEPASYVAECLKITPGGVYLDGHRLPVTDELSVETVDSDFHIVSLQLYTRSVDAPDHPRIIKAEAATYRYVRLEGDVPDPCASQAAVTYRYGDLDSKATTA